MRKKWLILLVSLFVVLAAGVVCRIYFYKSGGAIGDIAQCVKLGLSDEIRQACEKEKLIIDAPKVFGGYISAANAWADIARKTKDNKFYFRAIDIYKLALERFDAKYLSNWNMASIYRAMEDYKNVEKCLQAAIIANNTESEPIIALARVYFYNFKKSFDFVDKFYKTYLEKQLIDKEKLFYDYAIFLEESGKFSEAIEIYKQLEEKFSGQYEAVIKELETKIAK
jgi:tetratricopeptide (TPR) repeat protein